MVVREGFLTLMRQPLIVTGFTQPTRSPWAVLRHSCLVPFAVNFLTFGTTLLSKLTSHALGQKSYQRAFNSQVQRCWRCNQEIRRLQERSVAEPQRENLWRARAFQRFSLPPSQQNSANLNQLSRVGQELIENLFFALIAYLLNVNFSQSRQLVLRPRFCFFKKNL